MNTKKYTNVTVLMGGYSSEREVSLVSGKACVEALKKAGLNKEAKSMLEGEDEHSHHEIDQHPNFDDIKEELKKPADGGATPSSITTPSGKKRCCSGFSQKLKTFDA